MKLIRSPWQDTFFALLGECRNRLQVASPYVKHSFVSQSIAGKCSSAKIELITSLKFMDFYQKASDLEAIKQLLQTDNQAFKNQSLHAKLYIFDNRKAVISSGNWTQGGLVRNYEYGVLIEDKETVDKISDDYEQLKLNEHTTPITYEHLREVEQLILVAPRIQRIKEANFIIANGLSGWKKDVFDVLCTIGKEEVNLSEILAYTSQLERKHPNNNHIQAKIRQQLQSLRDIGLLDFLGNGVYRMLW